MQRNDVALLEQCVLIGYGVNTGLLDDLCRAESIVGVNLHAKAFGNAGNIAANVTESKYTQFLAHQFSTGLAIVEVTYGEDKQTEDQLGHGIGILSWGVLGYDLVGSSGSQVDVVVAGTGTNNYLQLLGSVEHLGIYLV